MSDFALPNPWFATALGETDFCVQCVHVGCCFLFSDMTLWNGHEFKKVQKRNTKIKILKWVASQWLRMFGQKNSRFVWTLKTFQELFNVFQFYLAICSMFLSFTLPFGSVLVPPAGILQVLILLSLYKEKRTQMSATVKLNNEIQ